MTQVFISRAELLPAGESTEEHRKSQQEEAYIVDEHKTDTDPTIGGLFRGTFKGRRTPGPIIHDAEDGVDRCPICSWELEGGFCNSCQTAYGSDNEFWSDSDDHTESETSDAGSDGSMHGDDVGADDYLEAYGGQDDISLDGDGQSLHAHDLTNIQGNFTFGRSAAQGLIGRPIGRLSRHRGSPAGPLRNRRRYAPSTLSDVATTGDEVDAFSTLDAEDEQDHDTLDGFLVDDDMSVDHESDGNDSIGILANMSDDDDGMAQIDAIMRHHGNSTYNQRGSRSSTADDNSSDDGNSIRILEPYAVESDGSSESEPAVLSQRSRKRRRIVNEVSSDEDENVSEEGSERSRPRRRISSSGSTTIGHQSPAPEPMPEPTRQRRRAQIRRSPIVIPSSSVEPESPQPARRRNTGRRSRRVVSTDSEENINTAALQPFEIPRQRLQTRRIRRPRPNPTQSGRYSPELHEMDVTVQSRPDFGSASHSDEMTRMTIGFGNQVQGFTYNHNDGPVEVTANFNFSARFRPGNQNVAWN